MCDLLNRTSRRGRTVRFIGVVVLGLACARTLAALGVPRALSVIPVATLVACLLMLPPTVSRDAPVARPDALALSPIGWQNYALTRSQSTPGAPQRGCRFAARTYT
jgi:hypothetical protein